MDNTNRKDQPKLRPALGLIDATAISVGAIIGAGIYVVTGIAAGFAGPAMLVSMILASLVALLTALSFSELSSWFPREGSVYIFSYRLISPFAGFLAGWMYMLGNVFGGASVSLGFANYFTMLIPIVPARVVAVLLCTALIAINYFGIRRSAELNNILVGTKLLILSFFIILGLGHLHPSNFQPFVTSGPGIIFGACYIFFAFGGFARVSVIAEEIKDAQRTVPKAIMLSLLISTVFYLLIGIIALGLVGAPELAASRSPLAAAIRATGNSTAVIIITLGGLLATASVLLTTILGVSREAYAMALKNALPSALAELHPDYGTPYRSIWIIGILMILLASLVNLENVVAASTFGQLFYYSLANISDIKLRLRRRERLFLPALGAISCLTLLAFLFFIAPYAWALGIIQVVIGGIYYRIKIAR